MSGKKRAKAKQDTKAAVTTMPDPEEFIEIFKRGVKFTEELLQENERLRSRIVSLEEENRLLARKHLGPDGYRDLLEQLQQLDERRKQLEERFEAIENENRDYRRRHEEMEQEYNRLANLYIASYQLHSSLELEEVVRVVSEIILNLIGGRAFVLFLRKGRKYVPVHGYGCEWQTMPAVRHGEGILGKAASEGVTHIDSNIPGSRERGGPAVCIPLTLEGRTMGIVAIYQFLEHKGCITDLDRELFGLLGVHAASALTAAMLYASTDGLVDEADEFEKIASGKS